MSVALDGHDDAVFAVRGEKIEMDGRKPLTVRLREVIQRCDISEGDVCFLLLKYLYLSEFLAGKL